MPESIRLGGEVTSGAGEGAAFVGLEWVQEGFERLLGFRAFPGTLNLRLTEESARAAWADVRASGGLDLPPGAPGFCPARLFPCRLRPAQSENAPWRTGAAVLPVVEGYPADARIEIVAPEALREAMGVGDGEKVEVEFGGA